MLSMLNMGINHYVCNISVSCEDLQNGPASLSLVTETPRSVFPTLMVFVWQPRCISWTCYGILAFGKVARYTYTSNTACDTYIYILIMLYIIITYTLTMGPQHCKQTKSWSALHAVKASWAATTTATIKFTTPKTSVSKEPTSKAGCHGCFQKRTVWNCHPAKVRKNI